MSEDTLEAELAHFGVKGMRWGVRKRREIVSKADHAAVKEVVGVSRKTGGPLRSTPVQVKVVPGKPVQTRGGKHQPTAPEAVRSAALKQKVKVSGKQSLTNEEMRFLIDRLSLEERLSKVNPKQKNKGLVFAQTLLASPLPALAVKGAQKQVIGSMKGVGTAGQYNTLRGLEFAEKLLGGLNTATKSKKKEK